MSLFRSVGWCALVALMASSRAAHAQVSNVPWPKHSYRASASFATLSTIEEPGATATRRLPPTHSRPAGQARREELPIPGETVDAFDPQAGMTELVLPQLVDEVQRRNPSLAAAAAAWRAAAQRYPQVVSLDDPMFDWMMAPASLGSNDVDFAYVVQGRQKIPWSGKRPLRGQVAARQSRAASLDVADVELRLTEAAKQSFYEYFLVFRQVELNDANRQALQEFRRNALQRYESNLVSQQDVLLADVELADLERRQVELHRASRVAVARINTLLLRVPDAPLPPPPSTVEDVADVPPVDVLRDVALAQRPDLGASMSRLRAEQASVALARREFGPDLEFVGRYDTFWQSPQQQLQGQIGVTLNVPLAREKRRAAVREATARVSQQRAEVDRLVAQIQFEVQEAYERVDESRRVAILFRDKILPAANASVESAQAGYVAGKVDFLRLVEAQRQRILQRERQVEAIAEYHRRRAELERVIGGVGPLEQIDRP